MKIVKSIFLGGLIFTLVSAESPENNASYIDETHTNIDNQVMQWSDSIDTTISGWLGYEDNNKTNEATIIEDNRTKAPLLADAFFQSNKYLDETESTFIRLRTDTTLQTRESHKFNLKLSAQIPFSKSKQNFKFFVNDLNLDNAKDVLRDEEEDSKLIPDIGMHYFGPEAYGIDSRYSLGLSGFSPFVRARYNMRMEMKNWIIDPVQIFKYSTDDKFEEETNIYIDRAFEDLSLFRLQLHRKTQAEIDGMDYSFIFQYYWSNREKTGLRVSQSFFGNTEYPYITDNSVEPPKTKSYGGIHNYVTTISWRENIWRKWFYYEISPTVNFHKDHDYKENYAIRVFFDFYFGQYD